MNTFDSVKTDLLEIKEGMLSLFGEARELPGMSGFDEWEKALRSVEEQVNEGVLRVAVVGTIKSGKSTFVNSFLGGDYLKRGGGVVTSIVTRIRKGPESNATLYFKTWEEINADIRGALTLFPFTEQDPADKFDIRNEEYRERLKKALASPEAGKIIVNDTFDASIMLLNSYLAGYDKVKKMLSEEGEAVKLQGRNFAAHRDFAGSDSLAVYLKDIELQVPACGNLSDNVEIADCQGSDSPNPFHLSMIQEYLLQTHLIIYILSSRTGMRQADIRFLSMIKDMGLAGNMLFVINCDLDEHENLGSLTSLVGRISEEISAIRPGSEIFAFSSLLNLLERTKEGISEKEKARLEIWKRDDGTVSFSDRESRRFFDTFHEKLTKDRFDLLLKNHIERLAVMATGLVNRAAINRKIMANDSTGAKKVLQNIKNASKHIDKLKSMMRDTLDGTVRKAIQKTTKEADGFLDARYGKAAKDALEFIGNYSIDYQKSEKDIEEAGFSTTLYFTFQDFKRDFDIFTTQTINPEVIGFAKQEEKRIEDLFYEIAVSYDTLAQDTIKRYEETLEEDLEISSGINFRDGIYSIDLEDAKRKIGLKISPIIFTIDWTVKFRAEAFARLGFHNVAGIVRKLLKRSNKKEAGISALKDSIKKIKREAERSVAFTLNDYRENLKFQYLFKLIEAISGDLYEKLTGNFAAFSTDISNMVQLVDGKRDKGEKTMKGLESIEEKSQAILNRLNHLKEKSIA